MSTPYTRAIEVERESSIHIVCSPNSFEPRALCARGADPITVPHAEETETVQGISRPASRGGKPRAGAPLPARVASACDVALLDHEDPGRADSMGKRAIQGRPMIGAFPGQVG
jgi:hypothetical protein